MAINFDSVFSIHDDALIARSRRSSILASNIANADTPNYKARDFDFKSVMQKATEQSQFQSSRTASMTQTHGSHFSAMSPLQNGLDQYLQYRNPLHASLDGNTVDSHVEQAKFSENAIQFQTSFTFLNSKVQGLIKAIKGE